MRLGSFEDDPIRKAIVMFRTLIVFFTGIIVSTMLIGQTLTTTVLPQFIEGQNPTNANRIPYVYRARIAGLKPSATYRYINQVVLSTDAGTSAGSGNCLFMPAAGNFVRTSGPGLSTAGNYGTFLTDSTGSYEGWFATEPTGNVRFVPGRFIFMRISLNDGGSGTTAAVRFTTADSVRVLKLAATMADSTGTGLRCSSNASAKNIVLAFDSTAGSGRPISGTFVESDSTDNSLANSYAAFYAGSVNGTAGAFGLVLPNLLPNGIRRFEERSLATGSVVKTVTDDNGFWPSGANTVNPSGGTAEIVLSGTDWSGVTAISGRSMLPSGCSLEQNYPNPFNPTTVVRYTVSVVALSLSKGGSGQASRQEAGGQAVVSLKIYDLLGREVATLVNGEVSPGIHSVTWNASNVRSGVYFCRLTAGTFVQTKKLLLVR